MAGACFKPFLGRRVASSIDPLLRELPYPNCSCLSHRHTERYHALLVLLRRERRGSRFRCKQKKQKPKAVLAVVSGAATPLKDCGELRQYAPILLQFHPYTRGFSSSTMEACPRCVVFSGLRDGSQCRGLRQIGQALL